MTAEGALAKIAPSLPLEGGGVCGAAGGANDGRSYCDIK